MFIEDRPMIYACISALEVAQQLACGTDKVANANQFPTRSLQQIEQAYQIVFGVHTYLRQVLQQTREGYGVGYYVVELAYREILGLISTIKIHLDIRRQSSKQNVDSASVGMFSAAIAGLTNGSEYFRVFNNEIAWKDSPGARLLDNFSTDPYVVKWYERAELAIGFIPVFGNLYAASIAILGTDLIGRTRSPTERAIFAASMLISFGASASKILKTASSIKALSGANQLTKPQAIKLAVGIRGLSSTEVKEMAKLAALTRAGVALNKTQLIKANFFRKLIDETAIVAEWLQIAKEGSFPAIASGQGSVVFIKSQASFAPRAGNLVNDELAVAKVYADKYKTTVMMLPENMPDFFRKGAKQIQNVKFPDALVTISNELIEIATQNTDVVVSGDVLEMVVNWMGHVKNPGGKVNQGAVLLINFLKVKSDIPLITSIVSQFFWTNIRTAGIRKLVLVDASENMYVLVRPNHLNFLLENLGRAATFGAAQLVRYWEEQVADADKQ
jgi:hypothetical protein